MKMENGLDGKQINCSMNKLYRKWKRKVILNFLYWREEDIHPSDANKIVRKYLNNEKL